MIALTMVSKRPPSASKQCAAALLSSVGTLSVAGEPGGSSPRRSARRRARSSSAISFASRVMAALETSRAAPAWVSSAAAASHTLASPMRASTRSLGSAANAAAAACREATLSLSLRSSSSTKGSLRASAVASRLVAAAARSDAERARGESVRPDDGGVAARTRAEGEGLRLLAARVDETDGRAAGRLLELEGVLALARALAAARALDRLRDGGDERCDGGSDGAPLAAGLRVEWAGECDGEAFGDNGVLLGASSARRSCGEGEAPPEACGLMAA